MIDLTELKALAEKARAGNRLGPYNTMHARLNAATVLEMIAEIERLRDAEARRARLAEEYAGALNEIERLREALKPFAEAIDHSGWKANYLTDEVWGPQLRLGVYRRAREALESKT